MIGQQSWKVRHRRRYYPVQNATEEDITSVQNAAEEEDASILKDDLVSGANS